MKENKSRRSEKSAKPPLQGQKTLRILVVDEDADIRQLSTEVLIRSGYQVDAAADGAAAWQLLNTDRYDLMITNHNLPRVSGVELLIKLHAVRRALPVIMASPALPKDEFTRYPWLHPAATLLMPYTVAEFLGTVQEVLSAADKAGEPGSPPPKRKAPPAASPLQA